MQAVHGQAGYRLRFDWGLDGADAVAADAETTVVLDVLSFTITICDLQRHLARFSRRCLAGTGPAILSDSQ